MEMQSGSQGENSIIITVRSTIFKIFHDSSIEEIGGLGDKRYVVSEIES